MIIKFIACSIILLTITFPKGYACEEYEYDRTTSSVNDPQPHKLLEEEALKKLINNSSPSSCNGLQASEYNMLFEAVFKRLFQVRPQHFENLIDSNNEASLQSNTLIVFKKFFDEWVQGSSLDLCVNYLKKIIEEKESVNTDIKTSILGFINDIALFLKYLASDDLNNPLKNPINKYVIQQVEEANLLHQKLKEQVDQQNDNKELNRLLILQNEIRDGRNKAMEEFSNHIFDLLKRMSPELSNIQQPADHVHITTSKKERESLEHYIKNEFDSYDEKEPNRLRRFSEVMARNQYNKAFHEMVCESFQEQYQASEIHKKVKSIWHLKLLDTINQNPKEASSRMPGSSTDGSQGSNFGYQMANSKAYQTWLQNPLVLASGDIIMDAFHYVAKLGSSLDQNQFLERFNLYLKLDEVKIDKEVEAVLLEYRLHPHTTMRPEEAVLLDYYLAPDPYDFFMHAFNLHLLEYVSGKPFISNGIDSMQTILMKLVGDETNLRIKALEALKLLQKFSKKMLNSQNTPKKGPTLGIGFNGPLFNNFKDLKSQDNEIWLTFSASGRKEPGYLFLLFVKEIAERRNPDIKNKFDSDTSSFNNYKELIKFHVQENIKQYAKAFNSIPYYEYKNLQEKYSNFMIELNELEFNNFSTDLKNWLLDSSN